MVRHVSTRATILLGVLLAACHTPAAAEPPGEMAAAASLAALPYKGWPVASFRVEGVPADLARPLAKGLALTGTPRWGGLLGRKRPALTPALLEEDLARTRLFLARNGHPAARVEVLPRPDSRRRVDLLWRVDPGPAVRVARVEWVEAPGGRGLQDGLTDLLPAPGRVFRDDDLQAAAVRLEERLRGEGRARARCLPTLLSMDSVSVALRFQLDAGPVCRVDSIRVTGVAPDLSRLAARTLTPLHGHIATPQALRGARDRLRLLGVFRDIQLRLEGPADLEAELAGVGLRAELAPRAPRTLEGGLGWWTDEGGRVAGRWSHANLFGGGRGLQGEGGASRVRQNGRLDAWWPAMGFATLRGEVSLLGDRQREASFHLLSRELRLGIRQQPTLRLGWSGGVGLSEVKVDDRSPDSTAFLSTPGRQTIFRAALAGDNTDNPLDPRRGGKSGLQVEWTVPGFFNQGDFLRLEGEQTLHRELGPWVLAARLRAGLAWPLASSPDLLPNRRFFAGGTDHRGFGRNRLGPRDSEGAPVGGEALALGSVELRLPLVWRLGASFFLDAGNVWRRPGEIRPGDVELAAGPALLVATPVGPLRADLGLRLGAADDGLGRWALHASIGHPF
jgi:outer membrane protein assembly factor BamA